MNNVRITYSAAFMVILFWITNGTATAQESVQETNDSRLLTGQSINVLCYNVLNGFRGGRSWKEGVEWIKAKEPDIAGLQELVGWNEERLKDAALHWNHSYVAAMKSGGYNIGLTSKKPIQVIERRTKGFHHGYIHCRTYSVDVIVTHLWPGTRPQQLREATVVRDLVNSIVQQGREVILMGDFNAHAATDKILLDNQQPLLSRRGVGDMKKARDHRFIANGKFTYDVMNTILEAPLHDLVRESFDSEHREADYETLLKLGSFPTRVLQHSNTTEKQQGFLERIDFILATPNLARSCTKAEICHAEKELESISDHYPVTAFFSLGFDGRTPPKKH